MGNSSSSELPLAGIICLGVFGYTAFIFIIVLIRYICLRQGKCQDVECGVCGKEGALQCSTCCISCSESCGCSAPSIAGCLNNCCPNKKLSCVDILLCQCCTDNNCFTKSSAGSCDSCFNNCLCPQCEAVNCCCIEIKVRQPSMGSFTLQRTTTSSPNYPPRDTFSPPAHVIGQENLLPSSPTSRVVTAQMHVNRAFDNTLAACEGQMEVKGTGNSKLKQNKLMKERNDTAEDFRHVQVKRRKAQEKTDLSAANDKRAPLKENSGKEIRSNKRPRRNKTSSGPELNRSELVPGEKVTKAQPKHRSELVPGEKLTKAQPKHRSELVPGEKVTKAQPKHRSELVPGEKVTKAQPKHRSELVPGEKVTKAQPKQSSLVKSHTSQCNHSYKKVTWRNQPSKPTDPKSAQARNSHQIPSSPRNRAFSIDQRVLEGVDVGNWKQAASNLNHTPEVITMTLDARFKNRGMDTEICYHGDHGQVVQDSTLVLG